MTITVYGFLIMEDTFSAVIIEIFGLGYAIVDIRECDILHELERGTNEYEDT